MPLTCNFFLLPKDSMEIHGLVAEAMILANASVGKRIYDEYKDAALLRHHPPPTQGQFERLVKAAKSKVSHWKIRVEL